MPAPKTAWGMEVGGYAIKAVRLEREGDQVSVTDFAVIPHKKVLSTPDLDRDEMIRIGLGQFISQKSIENEHLVMSVPGHMAFARFAKLPPVEPKKVPDIVKFEAVQQIPFPIEQVEWDYETFTDDNSPEVEVGIFAMTRERVNQQMYLYNELGIQPESLNLSPVSVYNAMAYDLKLFENTGPVVFLDIGTQATDLVVAEGGRCWIRTFPLGGTHFTEAIASTFKISYTKAEKLKHEAATSKYFKQIMQAMRPVFSDLLQDVQRSIGYYQTLHRESELQTMIGLGSTFKIPGLRKFLGQQLQMDVHRFDEFKRIRVEGREAADFSAATVNMASAYGLALQGLGLASIDANLVPVGSLREQLWHSKTKWFAAAAAVVLAASALMFYRPIVDSAAMDPGDGPPIVDTVLARSDNFQQAYNDAKSKANVGYKAVNFTRLIDYREVWPHIVDDVAKALTSANPQPELLGPNTEQILTIPAGERRLVQLEGLSGQYVPGEQGRRIEVTMDVSWSNEKEREFIKDTVVQWLRDNADRPDAPYRIIVGYDPMDIPNFASLEVDDSGATKLVKGEDPDRDKPVGRSWGDDENRNRGNRSQRRNRGGGGGIGMGNSGAPDQGKRRTARGSIQQAGSNLSTGAKGINRPTERDDQFLGGSDQAGNDQVSTYNNEQTERSDVALEQVAPIPVAATVYPSGSVYYRMPVVFEVELRDPSAKPQSDASDQTKETSS